MLDRCTKRVRVWKINTVKEIAVKAGALIMIGKLHRVDMKKLYEYIDSHSVNVPIAP